MEENRAAAYRLGITTLLILGVLTIVEFFVSLYLGSTGSVANHRLGEGSSYRAEFHAHFSPLA